MKRNPSESGTKNLADELVDMDRRYERTNPREVLNGQNVAGFEDGLSVGVLSEPLINVCRVAGAPCAMAVAA
jgi:hypothetical protein